jgi:hypothetical protein
VSEGIEAVGDGHRCRVEQHVTLGLWHLRTSRARAPYTFRAALRRCGARL